MVSLKYRFNVEACAATENGSLPAVADILVCRGSPVDNCTTYIFRPVPVYRSGDGNGDPFQGVFTQILPGADVHATVELT